MDNSLVVGVGNIYASESLFRAGIKPSLPANHISQKRLEKLVGAIREVLQEAIAAGGTTISDFVGLNGTEGYFNRQLRVYGKAGEQCPQCRRGTIIKIYQGGRSTFYCPVCQR